MKLARRTREVRWLVRMQVFGVRGGCVRSVVCAVRLSVVRMGTQCLSRWTLRGRSRRTGHRIVLSGSWRTLSRRLVCDISAPMSWILSTMMVVSRVVTVVTVVSRVVTVVSRVVIVVSRVVIVGVVVAVGRTVMAIRGGVDSRDVVMSHRVTRMVHRLARMVASRE